MRTCLRCLPVVLLAACCARAAWGDGPDPKTVDAKISALGLEDDVLPYDERPEIWLAQRMDAVMPRLIERLNDRDTRIATNCLALLRKSTATNTVLEALLPIARNAKHPINPQVILALSPCADPRVKPLLTKALHDTQRFPDPQVRAQLAAAAGEPEEAVRLIVTLLADRKSEWDTMKRIETLGKIGHAAAIAPLERLTGDSEWGVAVEACLALARIDLAGHGLTRDQEQFLRRSRQGLKASYEDHLAAWRELAALNRDEIRPYVLRMIASDNPAPGLVVLQTWKDREALPEIVRLMNQEKSPYQQAAFAVAYLDIEGGDTSIRDTLGLVAGGRYPLEALLQRVSVSTLTPERKLRFFREVRATVASRTPWDLAGGLVLNGNDSPTILRQLIQDETNVTALARYVFRASHGEPRRFGSEIVLALSRALQQGPVTDTDAGAIQEILDACAAYRSKDVGLLAAPLLQSSQPGVRTAAARVIGTCGGGDRSQAMSVLHDALASADRPLADQAVAALMDVPCQNEAERAAREQVVLGHLGQPSEDAVLRVLVTCCGTQGVARLTPLLDGDSVPRALHAAWILAQGPDAAARTNALRRLAIHAMFNRQIYQQGEGIDFPIVRNLAFHQTTGAFRPGAYERPGSRDPKIPFELLGPLELDGAEQAFSVRAYRHAVAVFPRRQFGWGIFPARGTRYNSSYVPLLRVIAAEDPWLDGLHVKGKLVAHFPIRKQAAEALALVTGAPAAYHGLEGEIIDSAGAPPEPYRDQDRLIARYAVDFVAAAGLRGVPQSDADWQARGIRDDMLRIWIEEFGQPLAAEIRREADRRGLTEAFREARFRLWQKN